MELRAGMRLRSAVDTTEVVVVRPGSGDVDVRCGGAPMVTATGPAGDSVGEPAAGFDAGTQIGKRYEDVESGVELLCSKPGPGSLSIGERSVPVKETKALPSSD